MFIRNYHFIYDLWFQLIHGSDDSAAFNKNSASIYILWTSLGTQLRPGFPLKKSIHSTKSIPVVILSSLIKIETNRSSDSWVLIRHPKGQKIKITTLYIYRPPVSTFFRKTAAISGFEVKKHAVFNCWIVGSVLNNIPNS